MSNQIKIIRFQTNFYKGNSVYFSFSWYLFDFFLQTVNPNQLLVNTLDPLSIPLDWIAIRQLEIDYKKTIRVETMHTACDYIHYFGGVVYFWNPTGIDGQYPVFSPIHQ